jgi:hypothetical protein
MLGKTSINEQRAKESKQKESRKRAFFSTFDLLFFVLKLLLFSIFLKEIPQK